MFPLSESRSISYRHIPSGKSRAYMPLKNRNGSFTAVSVFSVGTVADPGAFAMVPDISFMWPGQFSRAFKIINATTSPITHRPGLFYIIGGISSCAPIVPIGTNLCIDIKIIQQNKFPGQGMLVGRDLLWK